MKEEKTEKKTSLKAKKEEAEKTEVRCIQHKHMLLTFYWVKCMKNIKLLAQNTLMKRYAPCLVFTRFNK